MLTSLLSSPKRFEITFMILSNARYVFAGTSRGWLSMMTTTSLSHTGPSLRTPRRELPFEFRRLSWRRNVALAIYHIPSATFRGTPPPFLRSAVLCFKSRLLTFLPPLDRGAAGSGAKEIESRNRETHCAAPASPPNLTLSPLHSYVRNRRVTASITPAL